MLSDIINDFGDAAAVLAVPILLIATYRAFGIGRALMRGVYRNRAYWIGATAIDLIFFVAVADFFPTASPLQPIAFLVTFVVLIAFVDTSIGVAREADFFHRSIRGWERVRKPFAALLLASSAVALGTILAVGANTYLNTLVGVLGFFQLFAVAALIFSWGAVALDDRRQKVRRSNPEEVCEDAWSDRCVLRSLHHRMDPVRTIQRDGASPGEHDFRFLLCGRYLLPLPRSNVALPRGTSGEGIRSVLGAHGSGSSRPAHP